MRLEPLVLCPSGDEDGQTQQGEADVGDYLADFMTGRSIAAGDRIVALAIVPAEGGWPDATAAAAHPPVYPGDRFVPLSLPMTGTIGGSGFFEPDGNQIALVHLLNATRLPDWAAFRKAMNPRDNDFELSHPNEEMATRFGMRRKVVPGLSVMHAHTFEALCVLSNIEEDIREAAARAAMIAMDASERVYVDGDHMFSTEARLGKPYRRKYELKSGGLVDVPAVSGTLSETAPWMIDVYARDAIDRYHKKSHLTDGSALRATFEALGGFQRLCRGLMVLHRYFMPSAFANGDNLFEATEFQLSAARNTIDGLSSRPGYGPAYGDETRSRLEAVADTLREMLVSVENEIAAFPVPSRQSRNPKP